MYQVKFQIFMKLNDVSLLIKETYCSYEIEDVSYANRIKEKIMIFMELNDIS